MSKYARTYHFPFTKSMTSDDKMHQDLSCFEDKKLLYAEKCDGENTNLYRDRIHARSEDGYGKSWQTYMMRFWNIIRHDITDNMQICGENVYAVHSIEYTELPTNFFVFGILMTDTDEYLGWEDVKQWCELFGLDTVPELHVDHKLYDIGIPEKSSFGSVCEGYVVRNYNAFNFQNFKDNVGKVVRKGHVTTDSRWETNWKPAKFIEDPIERLLRKRG